MYLRSIFVVFIFIFLLSANIMASSKLFGLNGVAETMAKKKPKEITGFLAVKLIPAVYWKTFGTEIEYKIDPQISIGVELMYKIGRTDSKNNPFLIKKENHLDPGFSALMFGRYFFKEKAPLGAYAQFMVGYNRMIYADRNTRPFSLLQQKRSDLGLRDPSDIQFAKPIQLGIGAGYQIIVIPRHRVIANVLLGVYGQMSHDNKIFASLFIAPSIGYLFK